LKEPNENTVDATLKLCLKLKLSDFCADFKDGACAKTKRFMKDCPTVKPKRSEIVSIASVSKLGVKDGDKKNPAPKPTSPAKVPDAAEKTDKKDSKEKTDENEKEKTK
jgi:hypothetical protein